MTGGQNDKNNRNCKLMMVTASGTENFANHTTQLLDCFCSWFHYHLLNPTAKGIKDLVTSCQENGLQLESLQPIFGNS